MPGIGEGGIFDVAEGMRVDVDVGTNKVDVGPGTMVRMAVGNSPVGLAGAEKMTATTNKASIKKARPKAPRMTGKDLNDIKKSFRILRRAFSMSTGRLY